MRRWTIWAFQCLFCIKQSSVIEKVIIIIILSFTGQCEAKYFIYYSLNHYFMSPHSKKLGASITDLTVRLIVVYIYYTPWKIQCHGKRMQQVNKLELYSKIFSTAVQVIDWKVKQRTATNKTFVTF